MCDEADSVILLHRSDVSYSHCSVACKNVCNNRSDYLFFLGGGGDGTCKAKQTTLSSSFKLIFFLEDVSVFVTFYMTTKSELDISIAVVVTTFL